MAHQYGDDVHCPVCLDIFNDPVILHCGHSVDRACVLQWWKGKECRTCPVCLKRCNSMDRILNFSLTFEEPECHFHKEKQIYFCLDHQESACPFCRDSPIHAGHKFRLLDEVVPECRKDFQKHLQKAKKRLEDYAGVRNDLLEQSKYILDQSERIEIRIKENFAELHRFLEVEEAAKLFALREERQNKDHLMMEKIRALSREMDALSKVITSAEEHLTSGPVSFMNNLPDVKTGIRERPVFPKSVPWGSLIDEAKHVGNLKFSVWKRMKEIVDYTPVILDPNTVNRALSLSKDLTSVYASEGQKQPRNPERFMWNAVLGSALDSGTHVWDVEVGDNTNWRLGVAWRSGSFQFCTWDIGRCDNIYTMFKQAFALRNPSENLKRIRVQVDTNTRSLSFSESLTNALLYSNDNIFTWPHLSSERKMYPFFYTKDRIPLKILPITVKVKVKDD
ncbi:E3 ubiquitin-protein ligase TRIM35-like [Stigmatopora argus]